MKHIIFALIAVGFMVVSCNQQEDISGKIDAAVNQKASRTIDSLNNVCDKNFDTQLQSRVTAAIKSNNQLIATPKPAVKSKNKPAAKPKAATAAKPQTPKGRGGRAGIGKGGGLLKNKPASIKPKANTNTQTSSGTATSQPTKSVGNRPGVKNKKK